MANIAATLIKALTGKFNKENFPPVPNPVSDSEALYRSIVPIKTGYEVLTRTRGNVGESALLVKEVDQLFNALVAELDQRYSGAEVADTQQGAAASIEQFMADYENIIDQLVAHVNNAAIHNADTGGDTIINEVTNTTNVIGVEIDDGAVVTDKAWSSKRIDESTMKSGGMRWFSPYYEGPVYPEGAFVSVFQQWLMVANKETDEYAAPVASGDTEPSLPFTPLWQSASISASVYTGFVMEFNTVGAISALDIWVPSIDPSIDYFVTLADITIPGQPIYHRIALPTLIAGEWNRLAMGRIFVNPPGILMIYLNSHNTAASIDWSYPFVFAGRNSNAPASGQWTYESNNIGPLRISKTDSNGVDRSLDVAQIVANTILKFVQQSNTSKTREFRITRLPVDMGDYYEFQLTQMIEANSNGPGKNNVTNASADIPVDGLTEYVEIPDQWLVQPDWAYVYGMYADTEEPDPELVRTRALPITNDTAYGLRVSFQKYTVPEDWDVVQNIPSPAEE